MTNRIPAVQRTAPLPAPPDPDTGTAPDER